jgi:uncharacterized protein YggE
LRGKRPVYRASEGISVILHEPDRAGELVSAAIVAGATGVRGPRFFVGDTEAAYRRALGAAFDNARAKAATLAAQAGAALGPAISIEESGPAEVFPTELKAPSPSSSCGAATVSAPRAGSGCGAAPPPTKPGTATVTATVGVVFALQ